ncbi:MAG TPA: phospholipid phosphatase [Porphyromonadaceae bacterium]|nr:phospholipid phosphatase [Porphyromonadaceae bacterium]
MLDTLLELDRSLLLFFNQGHTLYWDQVMWIYTGKLVWIPLILSMIYVAFRCGGWREGVWFVLVAGLVALLCDQFSSSVCKPFFERYRPARDPDFSSMVTIVNGYRGGMFGFFSSHAANAAGIVVYTALIFRNKLYAATAVLWALLTCYSRMYLGVHYPGDILAGLLWGTLMGWGGFFLYKKMRPFFFGDIPSPYSGCRFVGIITAVVYVTFLFILLMAPILKFSFH